MVPQILRAAVLATALPALLAVERPARGGEAPPDYSVLRIHEVISSNATQAPADKVGRHRDMVEIYNSGPKAIPLGGSTPDVSLALSGEANPLPEDLWTFPGAGLATIPAGGYLVVFLDDRPAQSQWCEPYAGFALNNDGSEPITLWSPVVGYDGEGKPIRDKVDEVWLPPLSQDVSFGRNPADPGGALLPLEDILEHFVFYPPGQSTFGSCLERCPDLVAVAVCTGLPNGPGGPLPPSIERVSESTNRPAADEPVVLVAQVFDEKDPAPKTPENPDGIEKVELFYRLDGGDWQTVAMSFVGLDSGADEEPPRPLARWSEWTGTIPGQPVGTKVEFSFKVTDSDGLFDATPGNPCPAGVGPCDREFGGPGCQLDAEDVTCQNPSFTGVRYVACDAYFRYVVGYSPAGGLEDVRLNEIVPRQLGILEDAAEADCTALDNCPPELPDCCKQDEDFVELFNSSSSAVDLSGCWLSDKTFDPRGWQFPAGSSIGPGEYLIVWLDNDGGKCPDPSKPVAEMPCFWECPDPTDPSKQEYHASFAIDADFDQLYLFDREDRDHGVIDGTSFAGIGLNEAWARIEGPQGNLRWAHLKCVTPRATNASCCSGDAVFLRGDTDGDCGIVITDAIATLNFLFLGGAEPPCWDAADANDDGELNITDGIYTLGYLFLGGPEPPAPGPATPGCDPTPDDHIDDCVETCRG